MSHTVYAPATREISRQVFADGALSDKAKQVIAVAVAHVTQCPYCIEAHTKAALRKGRHRAAADGDHLGRRRGTGWRRRPFDPGP